MDNISDANEEDANKQIWCKAYVNIHMSDVNELVEDEGVEEVYND